MGNHQTTRGVSRLFVWLEFCYRVKQISCSEDGWSRLQSCTAPHSGQGLGDAEVSWITSKLEITLPDLFQADLSSWFPGPACPQCTTPPSFSSRVTIMWRWRERERRRGLARSDRRTGPWQPPSQLIRRIEINYSYFKLGIKSSFIRVCHSNDWSYGLTPDCFSSSQHETELKA